MTEVPGRPPSVPPPATGDGPQPLDRPSSLDGRDDDLLDVVYEIAMASLDQVISLSQADFLS